MDSSDENAKNVVKGVATAALTAAAIAGPAIVGVVGSAEAAPAAPDTPVAPQATAAAVPAPRQAPSIPCAATAKACVSLSQNEAWLTDGNGKVTYGPVPVLGGTSAHPTPSGTFHVLWKDADHRSKEFQDAPMPYSVFFAPGDAFHAGSLHDRSHGCIHLRTADAKAFFDALNVGDEVQVLP